ncbi:MAG TPA: DUF222 domain-containing protein [Pedococcus sp.]|nr:DUF222 domain-containing protein [Pedococcus sp.]
MSITPLVATPPLSAHDGVRLLHELLDRVEHGRRRSSSAAGATLLELDRALARLHALRLSLVAAAHHSGVASHAGMTGTGAWLAAQTRSDGATAAADLRLATALEHDLPATREALAAGEMSTQHAEVIAATAAQLPPGLTTEETTAIESALVARAKVVDPRTLRKTARRALSIAQRTDSEVDAHEDQVLRTQEERAWARSRLTMRDHGDGTTSGCFTVPTLAAAILRKTVQQLASPRRFADRAAAQGATTAGAQRAAFAEVDWSQRYGQAFVELLEHLPTDRLSGKVAATVVVTIDHEKLKDRLGAGRLDTADALSASAARRLACNAGLLPAVLGRQSIPLDLGRTDRFFSEAQRVALATRYDSCAASGCDRPFAWSELHHQRPWSRGGPTDLANAIPLCGHHHRRIHDPAYHHRVAVDARGLKSVSYTRRT